MNRKEASTAAYSPALQAGCFFVMSKIRSNERNEGNEEWDTVKDD